MLQDSGLVFIPGSMYQSSSKNFFDSANIFYQRWYAADKKPVIHFGCSFFKIVKDEAPYIDTLNVHVREYIDDKIVLDTMHIMRSYRKSENVTSDEYIFRLRL